MDRKNIFRNGSLGVLCSMAMLLVAAQSFGAVINSFFENSLAGWEYDTDNSVVWSSINLSEDGTGSGQLNENGTLITSQLWQRFLVDDGSQTLTFTVRTPQPGSGDTDNLYIGLFDDDTQSLLGGSDGFFHWDSDDGEIGSDSQYFTWDTGSDPENADITWVLYNFTVPVTAWNNGYDYVTLRFRLDHVWGTIDPYGNLSDPISIIEVDNVELHGTGTTPPVVPVPSAMGLVLAGLMALGIFKKKLV